MTWIGRIGRLDLGEWGDVTVTVLEQLPRNRVVVRLPRGATLIVPYRVLR